MITIKVDNSKAIARIRQLEAGVADMAPVFRTVGSVLVRKINLGFKLGIDPFGNPWTKLKLRKGQPLRDTGRLQRSITAKADAKGVTVGTNVAYARTHQFGATIEPKKAKRLVFQGPGGRLIFAKKVVIPARPFLPLRADAQVAALPPDWSVAVVRAIRNYIKKETA